MVSELESRGKFVRHNPNEETEEVMRILFKANQFREFSDHSGMPRTIRYELMKQLYEDFECLLGWRYYLEMFPYLDSLWVGTIVENHTPPKK